jgi:Neuraminidase (sialidase)
MYSNIQVTFDSNPDNARSESDLAVNPLNPSNMVGSSKRFTDIAGYAFSLAAYATFDAGQTWTETILSLTDTNGTTYPSTTDPAVAFDDVGNVYIVALPWRGETGPNSGQTIGISIYKSTDGGRTWGTPMLIHASTTDDKQAVWGDTSPSSPFKGHVYAAWDDTSGTGNMLFARTTDHGASWKGITQDAVDQPAGTAIPYISDSFSPEITVAQNGTVIIVWAQETGDSVKLVTSSDGGSTFSAPMVVASGITNLFAAFPSLSGWPTFPGASFRVITYATNTTSGSNLVVVWADAREGVSRIYYRHSPDGGSSWDGPVSGQPLLTGTLASGGSMQDFHPQVATTPNGAIGCVFYEYGPTGEGASLPNLINVVLAVSRDGGTTFTERVTVSDQAWDPALDAPNADANPAVTFIGDYFGLAASALGFFPFWTDTRTGIQEIWTARVPGT